MRPPCGVFHRISLENDWRDGVQVVFSTNKTLTTGLVGAYLGVELAKFGLGIRARTGDSFAIPLALALAIGRWGCFCNGCCFGQATSLPWGVDFGDGILRHPTQIYESIFHLVMGIVLIMITWRGGLPDQRLKLYLITYCAYRFLTEWIRPEPAGTGGLTFYQWVVALFALALIAQWRWHRRREGVSIPYCISSADIG